LCVPGSDHSEVALWQRDSLSLRRQSFPSIRSNGEGTTGETVSQEIASSEKDGCPQRLLLRGAQPTSNDPRPPPSQVRAVLLCPVDVSAPHTAAALCDRGLFTIGALQPVVSLPVFCVSLPHLLFLPPLPHDPPFFAVVVWRRKSFFLAVMSA